MCNCESLPNIAADWGIDGSVKLQTAGLKSFGQWAAANCAALPYC